MPDGVLDVAIHHEQVQVAIVVKVEEAGAEAQDGQRRGEDAGAVGGGEEAALPLVVVEPGALILEVGEQEVRPAVAVVVAEVDSH